MSKKRHLATYSKEYTIVIKNSMKKILISAGILFPIVLEHRMVKRLDPRVTWPTVRRMNQATSNCRGLYSRSSSVWGRNPESAVSFCSTPRWKPGMNIGEVYSSKFFCKVPLLGREVSLEDRSEVLPFWRANCLWVLKTLWKPNVRPLLNMYIESAGSTETHFQQLTPQNGRIQWVELRVQ
jgi:hypothetical protein